MECDCLKRANMEVPIPRRELKANRKLAGTPRAPFACIFTNRNALTLALGHWLGDIRLEATQVGVDKVHT
jgi:hypothetical protein